MAGRVIVLVAAVLVAVLGAVLVYLYADSRVEAAQEQLEPVVVLVASVDIPEDTTVAQAISEGLLEEQPRPANALPEEPVTDPGEVGDLVLSSPLLRNEVLALGRLVDPDTSDVLDVEPQHMAIAIALDDPNRVAAFVEPGDRVAVFLTTTVVGLDGNDEETGPEIDTTQLLVPEVRVVGVGSRTAPDVTQTDDVSRALVTVSVTQADAEKLILGETQGELYLGLLTDGADGSVVTLTDGVDEQELLRGTP